MLLGTDHRPLPPTDINRRLRQIDPHLELMWAEHGVGGPGWWVIYRWPENEPRRRMIRAGQMDPKDDFDLYAQLPADCPPEQAYGYVRNAFVSSGSPEAKRLLSRVGEWNRAQEDRAWQPIIEEAHEIIEARGSSLFAERGERKVVSRRKGRRS